MGFIAVELDDNKSLHHWVAVVMQGFIDTSQGPGGVLAHDFTITEAPNIAQEHKRLFLVSIAWNLPTTFWILGLCGGLAGYYIFHHGWILSLCAISIIAAYLFSNDFIKRTILISLRKHGYKGTKHFYNAEQIIRLVGIKQIATTWPKQQSLRG